ncbi:amino acid adenylation domain-containing protein [Calothrix sp. FACHB-1219]|uniref:non-ribosomal peptide synthetase family protein n=1 Tax=unclassified Calothrix TaxID=2619626 RepID=UPI001689C032|nr:MULTISPECIES: non-ribosomal peptide synthetase [unclassified Calothrix]MBD2201847.1 amino acid adenylation domain-containing protein [Calothrix sp. FACHB-168]MBD2217533.1 amino acid adenylation domain-containing protein [Calothrix sp. FACHB-1219]
MKSEVLEGFQLSPQQKRLWLLQQDSQIYVSQVAILLTGIVDIEVLQAATHKVVNRHEILRTGFHRRPGIKFPLQVINASSNISWCCINLRNFKEQEERLKIAELLQEERCLVSQSETADLVRFSLLSIADNQYILIISLPSLYADGWTMQNLVKEISLSYTLCLQGQYFTDEPVQYLQFSEWQNELLTEEDAKIGKNYWQEKEVKNIEYPKLYFELSHNRQLDFQPDIYSFTLTRDLTRKIADFVAANNTKYRNFFLTCWYILLKRLSKQAEIVIHNLYNGRKYEELHETLGLLAKFLPLSCPLTPEFKFTEVLAYISEQHRQGEQYQEYFLEADIRSSQQEWLSLPICFEFEETPETYHADGVEFSIYQKFVCWERFKLKLNCIQQQDSLITEFAYNSHLFTAETIQRLARQFQTLVTSVVTNPNVSVGQLEIIDSEERHQLLVEFNHTQTNYPQDKCFHQLFEEQVNQTPHQIAVVFGEQQLTYAELNLRANRLASYLKGLGVKPDVLVGLYIERSLDTIVAILGILKAGGAYLPLDPALPTAALAYRLQDAGVSVLLTQRSLISKIPADNTQIICLDTDWELINQSNPEDLTTTAKPENLVYAIYTSGSTGKPKAVLVEHRQLVNYIYAIIDRLNLAKNASFATVSTFAADLGNTVIFPSLCTGGCLHIIPQETAADPQALADYFQQYPIDYLKIVPSHLTALLAVAPTALIIPRKSLILGGEASNWQLINQIQKLSPKCQIFNHYGPTETTVGALTYSIPQQTQQLSSTVPLGKPLANTLVYVLDEKLQLVPIGVPGELYIGGAGLARGYLNQPELTNARFIQNPFVSNSQAILYKTGDKVRYLNDGNLEFLGRSDRQVKIRGFRIELEEIETIIKQHSGVQEVVVTTTEDTNSNKRLIAYIVTTPQFRSIHQNYQAIATVLRNFCVDKLPEYAIPSSFILLKALPLTANGKIDYQALPNPEQTRPELEQLYVAPRTDLERQLAEIWAEILGLEQVGIHDNFFELGGHSLLITQLLAKLRKIFSVELPLKVLFDAPTVADLAAQINNTQIATLDINLDSEVVLDAAIIPATQYIHQSTPPTAILLTGATGFLGAFLLYELLQKTTADIYCLIRANTTKSATEKLQNHLKSYLLWDESCHQRIIPLIGDLSQSLLGLTADKFAEIAAKIDVIYHNGAFVNFTYPYSQLKAANVLGTQEILRLASQIKVKPVHFISTIGVVNAADSNLKLIREDTPINHGKNVSSGYTQSKWVAEKLVQIAGDRGIPISIYRPGRISGNSQTGVCNIDDHTFRMIRGCIQLGSVPNDDTMVNLTPVDYASQAIIYLSQQPTSLGKVFHIINPQPLAWEEVVNSIISFGYPLQAIDYPEWRSKLLEEIERSPNNPLSPLVATLTHKESQNTNTEDSPIQQIDMQNTLTALAETTITCPPLNQQLLNTYLYYLIHNSFLENPPNHS